MNDSITESDYRTHFSRNGPQIGLKPRTYGWCSSQTNFHFTQQFHSNHSGMFWGCLAGVTCPWWIGRFETRVSITHIENRARRIINPEWWNSLLDYIRMFFLQPWWSNKNQIYPQALSNRETGQKVWNNFFQILNRDHIRLWSPREGKQMPSNHPCVLPEGTCETEYAKSSMQSKEGDIKAEYGDFLWTEGLEYRKPA